MHTTEIDSSLAIYVEKLVYSMPKWIQDIFEEQKCEFKITKDGYLSLQVKNSVPKHFKDTIIKRVRTYLDSNKIVEVARDELN